MWSTSLCQLPGGQDRVQFQECLSSSHQTWPPHEYGFNNSLETLETSKSRVECPVYRGFYLVRCAVQLRPRGDSRPTGFENQSRACHEHSRWKVKREIPETRQMGVL